TISIHTPIYIHYTHPSWPLVTPSIFFFHATSTSEIYTLSLHDALPISGTTPANEVAPSVTRTLTFPGPFSTVQTVTLFQGLTLRSEEHTSELQSLRHLVCRLLLEKKKKIKKKQ